ncbi:membrane protein [Alkalihalobacillus alcalophilus ATCC 27647 = CGMCC 1.3604]|uniref:Membrane protein n=1 Tax=Alkalihalobacillus alcalophilus ATCC 27647 = CGMCC 1.3604 TaxID=1218173 RepID=A0A094WPI3_ALKAL|nr:DUF1405 domain-containing protein [Alkalihalobacillus alcalophilus]KGA97923.1 membrane protein [Alkalihalobacillus alcalophilus ATCC 27647 = CGMCC 1.3604]MED1562699.1 DUF1405 domain-containing protein [Alkalihalobacillus alcalophilus]THG92323.1 membrane protein [Alkalihalobacillus alcalophilus ATCC 27647 = CGMCC 1.3604]
MIYLNWLINWLGRKRTIWLLFMTNLLGTIYGYIWYMPQLVETELWFWPFVPDSPTASLFFTITLLSFLVGKKWPLIEAFGAVTLFKYGIWAVVMIVATNFTGGTLHWTSYMLIVSHIGMAVQALFFSRYFRFKLKHLLIVALWTLTNDILDYSLGIFPWLYSGLHPYLTYIYFFTVSLSITSILVFYVLVARITGQHKNDNLV